MVECSAVQTLSTNSACITAEVNQVFPFPCFSAKIKRYYTIEGWINIPSYERASAASGASSFVFKGKI